METKFILILEGSDDLKVWNKILEVNNPKDEFFLIPSGGTNIGPLFKAIIRVLEQTKSDYLQFKYIVLVDEDEQGRGYIKTIKELIEKKELLTLNENIILITLKDLNVPYAERTKKGNNILFPFTSNEHDDENIIEIEQLCTNEYFDETDKRKTDLGIFLERYNRNDDKFSVANNAFKELLEITKK